MPSSGEEAEAAGDEFEPEQDDDDQADREDDGADQRLAGGAGAVEGEAGGEAEQRARHHAADEQVHGRQRELALGGLDHRLGDIGGFDVVHGLQVPLRSQRPKAQKSRAIDGTAGAAQRSAALPEGAHPWAR